MTIVIVHNLTGTNRERLQTLKRGCFIVTVLEKLCTIVGWLVPFYSTFIVYYYPTNSNIWTFLVTKTKNENSWTKKANCINKYEK